VLAVDDDAPGKRLIYSPEMPVIPMYRERLRRVIGGTTASADAFINRHIRFIDHPPGQSLDDGDIDIDEIIRRTAEAVLRDDIRLVIIDPWNEVEHNRAAGENISDYVASSIRNLRHMAQRHKLSVGVVAHPTKDFNKYRKRATGMRYSPCWRLALLDCRAARSCPFRMGIDRTGRSNRKGRAK